MIGKVTRLLAVLCALTGIFSVFAYYIEPKPADLPFEDQQVWKHRQNEPELANLAIDQGFSGIELDVTFINGDLYIAHDPSEYEGAVLLRDYLAKLNDGGSKLFLWLDIKNISLFNEGAITKQLLSMGVSDRMLVETPRPFFMFRLCSSGLLCTVWVKRNNTIIARAWYRIWINLLSHYGRVGAISVEYNSYELADQIVPESFPKFLYTLPAGSDLDGWRKEKNVMVLLTD